VDDIVMFVGLMQRGLLFVRSSRQGTTPLASSTSPRMDQQQPANPGNSSGGHCVRVNISAGNTPTKCLRMGKPMYLRLTPNIFQQCVALRFGHAGDIWGS
jgi:hypothetical protein